MSEVGLLTQRSVDLVLDPSGRWVSIKQGLDKPIYVYEYYMWQNKEFNGLTSECEIAVSINF